MSKRIPGHGMKRWAWRVIDGQHGYRVECICGWVSPYRGAFNMVGWQARRILEVHKTDVRAFPSSSSSEGIRR